MHTKQCTIKCQHRSLRMHDFRLCTNFERGCSPSSRAQATHCAALWDLVQAFGNAVNPVFTLSLPESRGWVTVMLQCLLIVQACICFQLWARPT